MGSIFVLSEASAVEGGSADAIGLRMIQVRHSSPARIEWLMRCLENGDFMTLFRCDVAGMESIDGEIRTDERR